MSKFLTTEIDILDFKTDNTVVYIGILFAYATILVFQHYLGTNASQLHREALSQSPGKRSICSLVGVNILRTLVHIINVVFITSNNLGMIIVSVFGHALGVYLVYTHQRADHRNTVHRLLQDIQNLDNKKTQRDVATFTRLLRDRVNAVGSQENIPLNFR